MTRSGLLIGLAATALAASASAQPTLTAVDRFILLSTQGGSTIDGPYTFNGPDSGPWSTFEFSAVFEDNGGSTGGFQDTTIDVGIGAYWGEVDARADAFSNGTGIARSYCQSHFAIDFSLFSTGDYTLSGFVNAFGTINGELSEAYIRLLDVGSNSVIWSLAVDNAFEAYNQMGTLPAGNYRFQADALTIVDHSFMNSWGESTATVNFNLTVTPAPGPASLLALGMAGFAGRRR